MRLQRFVIALCYDMSYSMSAYTRVWLEIVREIGRINNTTRCYL